MRIRTSRVVLFLALALSLTSHTAFAADLAAHTVVRLFIDACIPNMGKPEDVRKWAEKMNLREITDPIPLYVFVGEGKKGKAWAVPTRYGNFALAIRGQTQACAVYAQAAKADEVESMFRKIVEGSKRPGMNFDVLEDKTLEEPTGNTRVLVYELSAIGASTGFVFIMLTTEHPDGAFQASLRVAAANVASSSN
ncbi:MULTISPECIES: hypothetical protein [Burkholderiaceae]|uniref:NMCC_0638 family (lipo)protein n=1 Tax=Burkholderiaceae TaxID=119060 RepID=UPI00095A194C|nr:MULTISPECIES: hypothetical protein [Burkholderiaceae]MCG1017588.1 hypothetical protein [Mycetohabitans sp. B4]SIT68756.1 hypothetical protein SAMN04487768_1543 [Burkholderia sp. b13]